MPMTVSVLIVDDSGFFRRRLTDIINNSEGLEVVGTAADGREAVQQVLALKPDVVTMDYEMPVMDGITAVKKIMAQCPTPVLMFSSLTHEGARVTLDALDAGAVDYLPKNFDEISRNTEVLKQKLCERIRTIAGAKSSFSRTRAAASAAPSAAPAVTRTQPKPVEQTPLATPKPQPLVDKAPTSAPSRFIAKPRVDLVAIGTSTGGPVALQEVLSKLPATFPLPLVLIQHMPASFTNTFAERLNAVCKIKVVEAKNGDVLRQGVATLAPGGQQLMIASGGRIKVLPGDDRVNYKPSVDITFGSAAKAYSDRVLAVILTGMGADGCEGAKLLKQQGATVWSQDKETSVIYGMPMAVAKAGLSDNVLPLDEIGKQLAKF